MAKFTIYFKDKVIESHIFDSGVVHIGREDFNDLVIDNLAIAPAHAVVVIKEDNCIIKQLDNEHPLIINNNETKETPLQNKDVITVGKHTIVFSTTELISPTHNKDVESLNGKIEETLRTPDANLQILSGDHIGRILPLKKAMTRFGSDNSGVVIIAKRKDGYFLSSLENDNNIKVNNKLIEDKSVHLKPNDVLVIDNTSMQFFLDPLS